MKRSLHKFLLLALMLSFQWGAAQTQAEAAKITSTYNQSELNTLKNESESRYAEDRARVLELAPKLGLELIIDDGKIYAELQRILADGTPIYYQLNNRDASHSTRTDHLNIGGSLGLSLMGQNMTAHVWDGGLARSSHLEYGGAGGNNRYSIGDGSTARHDHSGHVAGTIMASGVSAQAKGMAPYAKAVGYDWNNDLGEAVTAANNGMLISNHSYGYRGDQLLNWYFGAYIQESRDWDNLMFQAPYYLMVVSAGNDGQANYNTEPLDGVSGYDKLSGNSTSKNNLVVANANDANVNSNGELIGVSINPTSSQGPTDDYRIKPDITGNGTGVYSTLTNSNNSYGTMSGTSMASPNVAGSLLLLQEHYNNINSEFMKAATLKGLALHTADDAGPSGPDAVWGWGLLNAKRAAETISNNEDGSLIQELTLQNGQTYEIEVNSDEINDLIVSISWTDRPGPARNQNNGLNNKNPVLINDLDLRVIKGNTTFAPWKLIGVTSNGKGDNNVDPFERVDISNASGSYTIRVTHKGSLTGGSQNYSLIITGISPQAVICVPTVPSGLNAQDITSTTASLNWGAIATAEYDFRYRVSGGGSWTTVNTADTFYFMSGLTPATTYETRVRSKCEGGVNSAWSPSYYFTTLSVGEDCGDAYDMDVGGLGDLAAGIALAADFVVSPDVDLSAQTVKIPMYDQVQNVILSFYTDSSGTPGSTILPPTAIVPVSQTLIGGNASDGYIYELELDITSLDLEFSGGAGGARYWMGVETTGNNENYWVFSPGINNGTNVYGTLDGYGSWEDLSGYGFSNDMSFVIEGNCEEDAQQFTVVTAADPAAGGATSGDGTYDEGDSVSVSAVSNTGYEFENWRENGTVVSNDATYTFSIQSDRNLTAHFQLKEYTVTTTSNPTSGGTTSGGGTYNYGDAATVSATANTGYTFLNWTENGTVVSSNTNYSFTVTGSRNLVANFESDTYTITTSSNPSMGGTTSGGGTYNYGDTATVSAIANTGFTFLNWTENGTVVSSNANYSFTVTGSRNLVANFETNAYTITTSSNPTSGGTTSGGGTYDYGDTATISATANSGFTFLNWTENGTVVSSNTNYSFTVTGSRNLVANFETNAYTITTSSNPSTGGTTSGDGTYNYGDTATISATANSGFTFLNWTENGTVVSSNANYSFTVTGSRNLVANFEANAYTITTSSNPSTGGTTSGGGTYDYGDTATISATANTGFTFLNWTENGTVVSSNANYSFTVTGSRNLVANFEANAYTITTSSNPTVGGTTSGDGTYNYGDTAAVSAVENTGFTFLNWTENGTIVSSNANYSFMVTGSRNLIANFESDAYTIATSSNPTTGGTTSGGGSYDYGNTATVSAVANTGYTFLNWTENDTVVSSNANYSFTVTGSRNLVANFESDAYTITTSSNPTTGGTTSGGGTYNYGDTATVSATANTGSTFLNWTENGAVVSSNANYSFTVTGSRNLVANFEANAYMITTSSNPSIGGTTSGGGTYDYGDTATVSATANTGYTFLNWTENGTVVSSNTNYSFTVTGSRNLVANFEANAYTITTSSNPSTGGTTSGGGTYNYGDTATVSAVANSGFTFLNWTENGTVVSSNANYSFTVTGSRNLVANFEADAYTITTSSNPSIGGTTSGGGTYDYGDTATVSATANSGYTFLNWTENGTVVSSNANYSFTVTGSRNLVANFEANAYTITTSSNPSTGGTTSGGGTYDYGDTATVSATANTGFTFLNWTENGTVVSSNANYSFTVTESRNLVAHFAINAYMIITNSNPTDGGSTSGAGAYNYGDTATVSAVANQGYQFENWTESGSVVSSSENYTFTVTESRNLTANFTLIKHSVITDHLPQGTGSTSGDGEYDHGEEVTVNALPNQGYVFVSWLEGGDVVSTEAAYSFMITEDRNLVALFEEEMGTVDYEVKGLEVYPNPFSDFLTVQSSKERIQKVEFFYLSGQFVREFKIENSLKAEIDTRLIQQGAYIIRVHTEKGMKTFKVLKK